MEKDIIENIAIKKHIKKKVVSDVMKSVFDCIADTISNDELKSIKIPVIGKWMPNKPKIKKIKEMVEFSKLKNAA